MAKHNVPDWYVYPMKKIKYMFEAHGSLRYDGIPDRLLQSFYPLAYYAAYFSIRASAFSYELMCQGQEKTSVLYVHEYEKVHGYTFQERAGYLQGYEDCREMYARGYDFTPVDLYKVEANRFQIVDGKLMPALSTIEGMGDGAADTVVEAAKNGPFLSKATCASVPKPPEKSWI